MTPKAHPSALRFLKDLLAASRLVSFLASTPKAFAFEGLFWLENGILECVFQEDRNFFGTARPLLKIPCHKFREKLKSGLAN